MNNRKLHITALLLLLVFAFPIAYQSVHVLNYHGHGHDHSTEKEISGECCNSILLIDGCLEENSCPVCDYEFSYNKLPEGIFIQGVSRDYIALNVEKNSSQYSNHKETSISPRAPPVLS